MILSLKNLILGFLVSFILISDIKVVYSKEWTNDVLIKDLKIKISQIYNISESDIFID